MTRAFSPPEITETVPSTLFAGIFEDAIIKDKMEKCWDHIPR